MLRRILLQVLALALVACAQPVPVTATRLQALDAPADELRISRDTVVHLSTGRNRLLPAGSRWRAVGALPQGVVYQPVDTVFIIVGSQVHEAWLVVRGGAVQGFYLPGESNFSPLSPPLNLP